MQQTYVQTLQPHTSGHLGVCMVDGSVASREAESFLSFSVYQQPVVNVVCHCGRYLLLHLLLCQTPLPQMWMMLYTDNTGIQNSNSECPPDYSNGGLVGPGGASLLACPRIP